MATVKSRPCEDGLLALKPFAESVDKSAMLEMVKGYVALKPCVAETREKPGVIPLSGIVVRYDCGFDTHAVLRTWSYSLRMETKKSFKPMKAGTPLSPDT